MSNKKILVVDDDKKVTEGVGAFLKAIGHDMLMATDGHQAMEFINKEKPVLVLLDIQLPGIPGMELLMTLREKHKDIKVFIITAYSKDVKWRCDEIGYDEFFEKPIELDPLIEAVQEVVSEKKKKEERRLVGTPKAKVLFVEPDIMVSSYTCALFHSKEFCKGEYEIKEINGYGNILETLYDYQPDVVVVYDTHDKVDNLAALVSQSSHKPKVVILHSMFPKHAVELKELEKQGIIYCNQNTMTDEEFRKANMKLIDLVDQECLKKKLVKK
ncbi:MAG: response regulator [Candidatus Omnitrophica bacterium]|nr:response regulator [Candidatus Omnitrophota bacterium]